MWNGFANLSNQKGFLCGFKLFEYPFLCSWHFWEFISRFAYLLRQANHIHAFGWPSMTYAAVHKFSDIDVTIAVHIQDLKKGPCIRSTKIQWFEQILHRFLFKAPFKLIKCYRARVVIINLSKEFQKPLSDVFLFMHECLYDEVLILFSSRNCRMTKPRLSWSWKQAAWVFQHVVQKLHASWS